MIRSLSFQKTTDAGQLTGCSAARKRLTHNLGSYFVHIWAGLQHPRMTRRQFFKRPGRSETPDWLRRARQVRPSDPRRDLLVRSAFRRDPLVASVAQYWIIHANSPGTTGVPLRTGTTSVHLQFAFWRDPLVGSVTSRLMIRFDSAGVTSTPLRDDLIHVEGRARRIRCTCPDGQGNPFSAGKIV